MSSPVPSNASTRSTPAHPDTAPLSAPRRLGLLLILLVLPVIGVCLPAIFVTLVFGQRPRPAPAATAPDTRGLRQALEFNASAVLPTPAALASSPTIITVRPEHVAARAERVAALARQYGGSVSEGLPQPGEKDLYVDVPVTASAGFLAAVAAPASPGQPLPPAKAGTAMDHLEVIVRAAADDE